jgi:large-conductance mechanosensitive channel
MYIENAIGVIIGVSLGYMLRLLVERITKPTTLDDLWDEEEWETLKRKVSEAFDRLESETVDKPKKKVTKPKTDLKSGKKPE